MNEESKTRNTRAKSRQMDILIDFMCENIKVATGGDGDRAYSESLAIEWKWLAKTLNEAGPPVRKVKEWRRVWSAFKTEVKRKLHDKDHKYSGKPLTENQEKVADLLGLRGQQIAKKPRLSAASPQVKMEKVTQYEDDYYTNEGIPAYADDVDNHEMVDNEEAHASSEDRDEKMNVNEILQERLNQIQTTQEEYVTTMKDFGDSFGNMQKTIEKGFGDLNRNLEALIQIHREDIELRKLELQYKYKGIEK